MARLCKCGRYTTNVLYCVRCQMDFPLGGTKDEEEDWSEEEELLADGFHIVEEDEGEPLDD